MCRSLPMAEGRTFRDREGHLADRCVVADDVRPGASALVTGTAIGSIGTGNAPRFLAALGMTRMVVRQLGRSGPP
jgi:hypothetical protein